MDLVKNATILYMDDDLDDILMLQDAFSSIHPNYHITQAGNGEEGLNRLHDMKSREQLPCLIILDLNMPKLNGKEVFQRIKSDNKLRAVPIVIFSTSDNPSDKAFFRDYNTEYIIKPICFSHFIEVAKRLLPYCAN